MMLKVEVSMLLEKAEMKPVATAEPRYTRTNKMSTPMTLRAVFTLLDFMES
jgi:hypothetical protein